MYLVGKVITEVVNLLIFQILNIFVGTQVNALWRFMTNNYDYYMINSWCGLLI